MQNKWPLDMKHGWIHTFSISTYSARRESSQPKGVVTTWISCQCIAGPLLCHESYLCWQAKNTPGIDSWFGCSLEKWRYCGESAIGIFFYLHEDLLIVVWLMDCIIVGGSHANITRSGEMEINLKHTFLKTMHRCMSYVSDVVSWQSQRRDFPWLGFHVTNLPRAAHQLSPLLTDNKLRRAIRRWKPRNIQRYLLQMIFRCSPPRGEEDYQFKQLHRSRKCVPFICGRNDPPIDS